MTSVDSAAFRFMRPQPLPNQLRDDGWLPRYDTRTGEIRRWVLPPAVGTHAPNLTWSQQQDTGTAWVTAEVSLPKHVYGSNTRDLDEKDLPRALDSVSAYTSEKTRVECDVRNGLVGRADYAENFSVGEQYVPAYLDAALGGRLPHFRIPSREGETTVTFATKSSRQVQLYGKHAETLRLAEQGKATAADVRAARGVLRVESRFRTTQACARLAGRLKIDRSALSLLSSDTARRVISMELEQLTLDRVVKPVSARLDTLLEHFGDAKVAAELYGFLALRDQYGDAFWRIPQFNISKPTYNRAVKKLKEAGLWLSAPDDRQLPPLTLARGRASKAA
jgi:hypothetical protein